MSTFAITKKHRKICNKNKNNVFFSGYVVVCEVFIKIAIRESVPLKQGLRPIFIYLFIDVVSESESQFH